MVLGGLLAGIALALAGTVFAVVRAVGLWRQVKRTAGAVGAELETFEQRAALADRHLDAWDRSNAELERARQRLEQSRARLQVLLGSLERSQTRLRWLRAFLPAR